MVIAVVAAVIEFAACCWLALESLRMCNLAERERTRLRRVTADMKAAQRELERTHEKLYIAETERDFYKTESENVWNLIWDVLDEKTKKRFHAEVAELDFYQATHKDKPRLEDSVKSVEVVS